METQNPPKIISAVIVGFGFTLFLGIAKMVYIAFQSEAFRLDYIGASIRFTVGISIITGVVCLLLWGLFRGSKIAFWIIIAHSAYAVVTVKASMNQFAGFETQWEKWLFTVQGIIQLLSAAALLAPQSRCWFFNRKSCE